MPLTLARALPAIEVVGSTVAKLRNPSPGMLFSSGKLAELGAEIAAGATVARHTHPGVESTYVVEGGFDLAVQGQADRRVQAGEGFVIPADTPHAVRNGDRPTKLASTYVVEKGKPLASPA